MPIETATGVHTYQLSANTRAVIKARAHIPLVSIAIATRGGVHNEPLPLAGVTGLMARCSIKGTQTHSAGQIAQEAEMMGGSMQPAVTPDLTYWNITVPAKHFERALELAADVAFNAAFPADEFEVERKLALADLRQSRDDMYAYPLRLCMQQAFSGHPYGNRIGDIERTLTRTTPDEVSQWYHAQVKRQPWVFVVGDVAPDQAAGIIDNLLPPEDVASPVPVHAAGWSGPAIESDARDKAQTALAIAFPGPQRNHNDAFAMQVLAHAVGGLGGRFFEELRSKKSLAYTVSLIPIARWLGGAFVAYIATSPEREAEAKRGLLDEFARLVNESLPAAEIERAQRYTIGTWQIRSQTNAAQLADLMDAFIVGPGLSEISEFEDRIRAVTAEDVLLCAQQYFDPAILVEGVVRGNGGRR